MAIGSGIRVISRLLPTFFRGSGVCVDDGINLKITPFK
jgi:hypothetical protein